MPPERRRGSLTLTLHPHSLSLALKPSPPLQVGPLSAGQQRPTHDHAADHTHMAEWFHSWMEPHQPAHASTGRDHDETTARSSGDHS